MKRGKQRSQMNWADEDGLTSHQFCQTGFFLRNQTGRKSLIPGEFEIPLVIPGIAVSQGVTHSDSHRL